MSPVHQVLYAAAKFQLDQYPKDVHYKSVRNKRYTLKQTIHLIIQAILSEKKQSSC